MPSGPYSIELTKSARKEFLRLGKKAQKRILDAFNVLAANPRSELIKSKRLRGAEDLYRIRVGDYRVVYEIRDQQIKIIVIKIGERSDVYRSK